MSNVIGLDGKKKAAKAVLPPETKKVLIGTLNGLKRMAENDELLAVAIAARTEPHGMTIVELGALDFDVLGMAGAASTLSLRATARAAAAVEPGGGNPPTDGGHPPKKAGAA